MNWIVELKITEKKENEKLKENISTAFNLLLNNIRQQLLFSFFT